MKKTLRDIVSSGPLAPAESVRIAIAVGETLSAEHRGGSVHGAVSAAAIEVLADGIVLAAAGIGSAPIAYRSPEQCRDAAVDQRTDIWSLGVCLYEMVSGERPFKGEYSQALVYSILMEEPPPVREIADGAPDALSECIARALKKEREKRFQTMEEMLSALRALRVEPEAPAGDSGGVPSESKPSIAVLPFDDMSREQDQEYFCVGIADEIINALNQINDLHVAARTSAFAAAEQAGDIREVGRKLNVKTVLEGSVRKAGDQLRITTQLIDVENGYHLWSKRFDSELKDIFAIQEEIARSIVQMLEVDLSEREKQVLSQVPECDIEAYEFYLRGIQYFYKTNRRELMFAMEMFQHAIERDPQFARAYAGLADCYSYINFYIDSSQANRDKALHFSLRALELEPNLAEAHASYALALSLHGRNHEAEKAYQTAISLNPSLFAAFYHYGGFCIMMNRHQEAAALYERACEIDPENYFAPTLLAQAYRGTGQEEKSRETLQIGIRNIEKHLRLNPDNARALYFGAQACAVNGEREKAEHLLSRAQQLDPDDPLHLYNTACVHSQLGNVDAAFASLEKALDSGFSSKEWIQHDSDFDSIRSDPRFQSILDRIK